MQPPNRPNREHTQNPTEYPSEYPRKQLHTTQGSQTAQINPFQNVLIQQLPMNHANYPLNLLAPTYPNEIKTYHTLPLQPEIPSKNINNPLLTKRSFKTLENSNYDIQKQRLAQQSGPSNNVLSIEELITRNYLSQPNLSTAFAIHPQEIFSNQGLAQTSTALPMNIIQPLQANLNIEIQNPAVIFSNQFPLQNLLVNTPHEIVPKIEGHFPLQRSVMENIRPPTEEIPNNFHNNIKKEEGLISESSGNNPILRLQETGNRITELLLKQNLIFQSFENRNNALQKSLYTALEQTKEIRESLKNYKPAQKTVSGGTNTQIIPQSTVYNSNISITPDMLISYLYNNQTDFEYNLILKEDLKLPLYRGRNFGMDVLLTDKHGTPIKNPTRIPLVVSIYTSENPPQHIEINNSGNKVLKGTVEKYLVNGIGYFEKVQIIEVTSHLRNGWIFLMIHPKGAHTLPVSDKTEPGQIDFRKVRPLVIDKVIVKAKRLKEKDTGTVGSSDDVHRSPPETDSTS